MPSITKKSAPFKAHSGPIPVTILSGFLGSGKTTLLERILTSNHGMKVAVIINDMSELSVDAALIKDHKVANKEEKLIQLQNGCICCTLRGDLLEELINLHQNNEFDYILIESTGIAEPMQVAETFSSEFSQTLLDTPDSVTSDERVLLQKVLDLGGLEKLTKIDTTVTVIDAMNFLANIETTDFLANRWGDSGQGEADRTVTDLMIDQIEFADVIIINKTDRIKKKRLTKIQKIIKSLNLVAKIIKTSYCKVPMSEILNTGLYNFEKAASSAGWLKSINEMTLKEGYGDKTKSVLSPTPETVEYGVNSFVYKSRKPFHPKRLYDALKDKFYIIEQQALAEQEHVDLYEVDEEEKEEERSLAATPDTSKVHELLQSEDEAESESEGDDDDEEELSERELIRNKKNSPFGPLLRSKGFFWLATRYLLRGEWSSAGPMLTLKGGIPWFHVAGLDKQEDIPPEALTLIKRDFQGPFGDRRNELVFIGTGIDSVKLKQILDDCLLTEDEYKQFVDCSLKEHNLLKVERRLSELFQDGFEDWLLYDDDDDDEDDDEEKEEEGEEED